MKTLSPPFSSLPSNPLFSSFVTLYTLLLLYFPSSFFKLLFSAGILFLYLLQLAATPKWSRNPVTIHYPTETKTVRDPSSPTRFQGTVDSDPSCFLRSIVEWDVGAPLEVIHEACCEGQDEEEEEARDDVWRKICTDGNQRYPSLSRYYPETDSDSDSDSCSSVEGVFPVTGDLKHLGERVFRWGR